MSYFHWDEAKKNQNGRLKKLSFSTSPKAEQFRQNFMDWLGIVGLIDAKGINVTQPIWLSGCPMEAQKMAKNTKKAVLALFWAYVGQPDKHIG